MAAIGQIIEPHHVPEHIAKLCKQVVETSAAGHVEELIDESLQHGIAHKTRALPFQVLCSPCNRGGYGINAFDAQENLSDIAETKWHDKLFKGMISDIPPEDFKAVVDFNIRQVEASNGTLAPVEPQKATYMTYWGGHTTQGMKSVLAKAPHWDDSLTIDGRLSLTRVAEKCPKFAHAIEHGAEYVVFPSWLFKKFPGLDDAVQAAGNTSQNIAKIQNDTQMLQKLAGKIAGQQAWEQIKEQFKKTRPKNLEALPHMYNFIRKFPNQVLISKTINFIKSCASDQKRKVDGDLYDALQQDYKGALQAPRVRFGALACLYADEKAGILTAGAIKSIGSDKKLAATLSADEELQQFADMITAEPKVANSTWAWNAWCQLCADVAAMLCERHTTDIAKVLRDKKQPSDYILHTGHLQYLCVQKIKVSCEINLTDKFDEHQITPAPDNMPQQAKKHDNQMSIRDPSEDLTAQMMLELGFKSGDVICTVKKEKGSEPENFKICGMANGKIKLMNEKLKKPADDANLAEFQQKKWKHTAHDKSVWHKYHEDHSQHSALQSIQNVIKSTAIIAIHSSWDQETLESGDVAVMCSPKAVVVNKNFAVNEFVLSPGSQTVQIKEAKDSDAPALYNGSGVYLGLAKIDGKQYYVTAASVPVFVKKENCRNARATTIVPYWMVEVTEHDGDANMKLSLDLSKCVIKTDQPEIKIPMLKNSKALKAGDKLVLFVPPVGKPPLKKAKTMKE